MKNTRLAVVFLLLAALAPASAQNSPEEAKSADLYEAVVRYQIKTWDLAANSYCVSIDGKDAAKDFLARFDPLPVKPASACRKRTSQKVIMGVVDKKSRKPAVIFDLESVRWLSSDEAEVVGGYLCGSLCMASGRYHLIRKDSRWSVTSFLIQIQS